MRQNTATTRYEANVAPGDLGLAQELANTIAVGPGADLLASVDSAARWVASVSDRPESGLDVASLEHLRQLRSAVRAVLSGDARELGQPVDVAIHVRISEDGVAVRRDGPDLVGMDVAVALLEGRATGALTRLRLCANPECEVAFYDQSKNGTGKWHSPTRCGNAARVRAHRSKTHS